MSEKYEIKQDSNPIDEKSQDATNGVFQKKTTDPTDMTAVTIAPEEVGNGKMKGIQEAPETEQPSNCCTRSLERLEDGIGAFTSRYKRPIKYTIRIVLFLLYMAYFVYCMSYRFGDEGSILLVVVTCILLLVIINKITNAQRKPGEAGCCTRLSNRLQCSPRQRKFLRYGLYLAAIAGIAIYLIVDVFPDNPTNMQSLLGILCIIIVCTIFSIKPSKINWHPVFWGFVIQFVVATITLQTDFGYDAFKWLGDAIEHVLLYSSAGSAFVIGNDYSTMGLAFSSSGMIIFFGALIGLLNHWGVLDFLIGRAGRALSIALETGPVESVTAIANIFIGLTQAPLLIRPYLPVLTGSELAAVMTCGYASVSGDLMTMFIVFGASANHLLTAAVLSAPAALAVSKILVPETEVVDVVSQTEKPEASDDGSKKTKGALGAASDGAMVATKAVVASMANMIAFVSLLALVDDILLWGGERAGVHDLTFDRICGYVLYPLCFAMGVPGEYARRVGSLIGVKLFATPVVAYMDLGKLIDNRLVYEEYIQTTVNGTWHWKGDDVILDATNTTLIDGFMNERSEAIATYAMCGFSALTAIGISIGTLTPLCPMRKPDIIRLVPAAFLAGNMASFATGSVAGLLYSDR